MTSATASGAIRARLDRLLHGLRDTLAIAWRGQLQIRRNPMELLDLSMQPIMFLLLLTYVFGGAIAGSAASYLAFALPGIIVQNALFVAMSSGSGLAADLADGVFDRLRALPIARWSPLAGRALADTARQAWSMALLVGVGVALGARMRTGVLGLLGAFVLLVVFALAASWVAVLVAALVGEPEKVQVFAFTAIFPLTFTSDAFVPANTMPGWLQAWVGVNPVTALADAIRGLLLGGPVGGPVLWSLLWGAGTATVFAPLALRALRRRA